MLKRISILKSIGCFFNDHPGGIQLEQLTIIFGENCYGKSTICDILRSLADNNPSYITDRKSVPNPENQNQLVHLNFSPPGHRREYPVSFGPDQWNQTLPGDLKIYVFDTDFIHRNVFTGLTVERRNQENITQFVLGEAGVRTAKDIENLNSKLRGINKYARQLISSAFVGIKDIDAFLKMEVDETSKELQGKIANKVGELKTKKGLEDNLEKERDKKEPELISVPENIEAFVEQVNSCLASAYQRAHDDASDAVEKHIKDKTHNTATTKNWLKTGLNHIAEDYCPFCGKTLEEEGMMLIEIYRSCFDEAFNQFEQETHSALKRLPDQLDTFKCLSIPELIQKNSNNIIIYPELSKITRYKRSTKLIHAEAKGLRTLWDTFQTKYDEESKKLGEKIIQKEKAIYVKTPAWTCPDLIAAYRNFQLSASKYNKLMQHVIDQINDFKDTLNPKTIAKEILKIEEQQTELEFRKKRKDSEPACKELGPTLFQKHEITQKIERLKEQLDREQSEFLNICFESINSLFARLGSGPFQIYKQMGRRGNMPVIQLTTSYAGLPISQDKIKAFFSESDRRALALSVFWAKIESLDEQQKQNSILVLDDPVTSFDDGRIDRTIRLMEANRSAFRQIIVLSHYPRYLKSFFERASLNTSGIQLSKIIRTQESSNLVTASPSDFVETEHQLKFRHIMNFIDRQHTENVSQDLRIFLEAEVKSRYRKQILKNGLNGLQFVNLLDKLLEHSIIDQDKRSELEDYRLSLNPEHHIWTERSQEDIIALSSDVLEFIYERL